MRRAVLRQPLVAAVGLIGTAAIIIGVGGLDLAFPANVRAQDEAVLAEPPASSSEPDNSAVASDAPAAVGTPFAPIAPAGATSGAGTAGDGSATMTSLGGADIAVSSTGGSYEVDAPGNRGRKMPRAMPKP
jgi:hypothetical protein